MRTVESSAGGGAGVTFTGDDDAAALPCAVRRRDVQKVLDYLAARGEKSRADLAAVCKYYGVTVTVTSAS